jgi:hypothetical protein
MTDSPGARRERQRLAPGLVRQPEQPGREVRPGEGGGAPGPVTITINIPLADHPVGWVHTAALPRTSCSCSCYRSCSCSCSCSCCSCCSSCSGCSFSSSLVSPQSYPGGRCARKSVPSLGTSIGDASADDPCIRTGFNRDGRGPSVVQRVQRPLPHPPRRARRGSACGACGTARSPWARRSGRQVAPGESVTKRPSPLNVLKDTIIRSQLLLSTFR